MDDVSLKNQGELAARLALGQAPRLLLVDAPPSLEQLLARARPSESPLSAVAGTAIRSVKERFDAILVWRENRVGSRSLFEVLLKRLEPSGVLWVITAMRKVIGPATPAAHRLELSDLVKAFEREGLSNDREARVSAWHVAYRFAKSKR
jgi:hypothetical protein